jgi:hypothetical protein
MDQQLDDFYAHLNKAVITTNDFAQGTKFRKREKVDQFAYCGLNQMYRSYLSFDLDMMGGAIYYEVVGLPPPTIITINPENAHCHYLYRLNTPVAYHKNSRSAPQDYFEAVQNEMEIRLRADNAYNHTLTKNPLHPRWKTVTNPASYDLSDFSEYFDLPHRTSVRPIPANVLIRGRNDLLFHTLRLWAYKAVQGIYGSVDLESAVYDQALEINDGFEHPLPLSEVKATAKSVARWTYKYEGQFGGNKRPKVLQFSGETAEQRMSMGADYTNGVRCAKSLQTLRDAAAILKTIHGEKLKISHLVKHTGMNIKTVRKYFSQI